MASKGNLGREVLAGGLMGGVLITLLKWTEYRFLVVEHSLAIYGGLTAVTFAVLGVWLGNRLTGTPAPAAEPVPLPQQVPIDLGLTPRELEVLELIARGMSNREIGEKLFVSENTVKTHCSRCFEKLGAKRRTQAVQIGKEAGLLR